MRYFLVPVLLGAAAAAAPSPKASPAKPPASRVVEASIFKDGHVLVRREVRAIPVKGEVILSDLPAPVLGSYHPYAGSGAEIESIRTGATPGSRNRPVADLAELLSLNQGARVRIIESDGTRREGLIQGAPLPPDSREERPGILGPVRSLVLKTAVGLEVVPMSRVVSLAVVGPYASQIREDDERVNLHVRLRGAGSAPVTVGAQYLQKGIRWLPGYRVDLDGQGKAAVHLQATVMNELVDLQETETRLVIGVPRIFNAGEVDPLLNAARAPRLSNRFQANGVQMFGGFGGGGLGGSLGGFGAGGGRRCTVAQDEADAEAAEAPEEPHEDLFYLPPRKLTLKKGETILLPLQDFNVGYEDVYTVDIPFQPRIDPERAEGLTTEQKQEFAEQLYQVRAKHQLRLLNSVQQPLTTGPVSVFRDGKLAAQSVLLFTPAGGSSLCVLGDAPEIEVQHKDQEVKRDDVPAPTDRKDVPSYTRIAFKGSVTLRNRSGRSVELEVNRNVPGNLDTVEAGDLARFDQPDDPLSSYRVSRSWVNRLTGSGRATWKVLLRPGEERTLLYNWHAFRT